MATAYPHASLLGIINESICEFVRMDLSSCFHRTHGTDILYLFGIEPRNFGRFLPNLRRCYVDRISIDLSVAIRLAIQFLSEFFMKLE